MAIVVSKADALLEMVKAYEDNETKKSNQIGQVMYRSIQKEHQTDIHSGYIELNKKTKQYFPVEIRKKSQEITRMHSRKQVEVVCDSNRIDIVVNGRNVASIKNTTVEEEK